MSNALSRDRETAPDWTCVCGQDTARGHDQDVHDDAAFEEIHRAAMDKMRAGLRREDGKILKPPGFVPPDMTEAIRNA